MRCASSQTNQHLIHHSGRSRLLGSSLTLLLVPAHPNVVELRQVVCRRRLFSARKLQLRVGEVAQATNGNVDSGLPGGEVTVHWRR